MYTHTNKMASCSVYECEWKQSPIAFGHHYDDDDDDCYIS